MLHCRQAPAGASSRGVRPRTIAPARPSLQRRSQACKALDIPESQSRICGTGDLSYELQNFCITFVAQQQAVLDAASAEAKSATLRHQARTSRPRIHALGMTGAHYTRAVFTSHVAEEQYGAPFRIPQAGEGVLSHPLVDDSGDDTAGDSTVVVWSRGPNDSVWQTKADEILGGINVHALGGVLLTTEQAGACEIVNDVSADELQGPLPAAQQAGASEIVIDVSADKVQGPLPTEQQAGAGEIVIDVSTDELQGLPPIAQQAGAGEVVNDVSADELGGVLPTPEQVAADDIVTAPAVCSLQFPGVMSCTLTTVTNNEDDHSCTYTISVRTRVSEDSPVSYATPEVQAMASRACAAAAATEAQRQVGNLQRLHPLNDTLHQILQSGRVVEAKKNATSEFGHESYSLKLQDPVTGRVIDCLFKPRVYGDFQGWHRVPIEMVAYKLGLLLGMDYVPPVAYREGGVEVDYKHFEEGAFIYLAKNVSTLKEHEPDAWHVRKEVLLSDARILDVLLENSDRHHGHFLIGEHWTDGHFGIDGEWHGASRPIFIDHAAGFRREAVVLMEQDNAFKTGPVKQVSSRTYARLLLLDETSLKEAVGHHLSDTEVAQLLQRRDLILRYIGNLLGQPSGNETVIQV